MFGHLSGQEIVYLLIALLVGMVIHELMHGVAARALGDTTAADMGRLTLNPLKHIDVVMTILLPMVLIIAGVPPIMAAKPVPFNPERVKWGDYGAALVGLAGPATNFVLALLMSFWIHLTNYPLSLNSFPFYFIEVNAILMVFNLIPFPPLDGSRVLYAFAPDSIRGIMRRIEAANFIYILVILLIIINIPGVGNALATLETDVINFILSI